MINKTVTIPCDMTGRYVQHLVYKISQIPHDCYVRFDDRQVNAKSVLGILSLDLHEGDIVEFVVNSDEDVNTEDIFAEEM